MMILKCITIYVLIGWLYEGICFLIFGGIEKYFDAVLDELEDRERYSKESIDFAIVFTIIVMPFVWPMMITAGVKYLIGTRKD